MARKGLATQVIEELDRARGILSSLQDSSDPIPGILIGTALESLHRIETMCISAVQANVNSITDPSPLAIAFGEDKLAQARHKAAATTKRPARARKGSSGAA